MSLVQSINAKPGRGIAIAVSIVLIGIVLIALQMRGGKTVAETRAKSFYSNDDGKTWFADDAQRLVPFDKDGKAAVLAHVYVDKGGKQFVGYLERLTPEAKKAIEDSRAPETAGKTMPGNVGLQGAFVGGREIKRPADSKWTNSASYKDASQILRAAGPDATPVTP